jgi:hypothetical protein
MAISKGTADVSPSDREKLKYLIAHYMKQPHPFTACFKDQVRHGLSPKHAAARCAVLKDLGKGTTSWRSERGKKMSGG